MKAIKKCYVYPSLIARLSRLLYLGSKVVCRSAYLWCDGNFGRMVGGGGWKSVFLLTFHRIMSVAILSLATAVCCSDLAVLDS